jgi:hypothetical protein
MRVVKVAILVTAISALTVGSALAQNPHFIRNQTSASINQRTGALVVNFRASGYGAGETVNVTLTADAEIVVGCVTPSGSNEPRGLVREFQELSATTTLTADRTGTVRGTISVAPDLSQFDCPSARMTVVLVSAEYTNIVLTADGARIALPDQTFTRS